MRHAGVLLSGLVGVAELVNGATSRSAGQPAISD